MNRQLKKGDLVRISHIDEEVFVVLDPSSNKNPLTAKEFQEYYCWVMPLNPASRLWEEWRKHSGLNGYHVSVVELI